MLTNTMVKVAGSWFKMTRQGKYGDLMLKLIDMKKNFYCFDVGFCVRNNFRTG